MSLVKAENMSLVKAENMSMVKAENMSLVKAENMSLVKAENMSLVKDDWIGKQERSLKLPALEPYARVRFARENHEYANLNTADALCLLFGEGSYGTTDMYIDIRLRLEEQDKYMWFDTLIPFLLEWRISPDLPYVANLDERRKLVIKTIYDALVEEGYDMTLVRVIEDIEETCGIPAF